jgi:aspartate/methionine/tyrosine aminotransferase
MGAMYFRAEATLTAQEIEAAHTVTYDLASGYPRLRVPDRILSLYSDAEMVRSSLQFPPDQSSADRRTVDRVLEAAVAHFLHLPVSDSISMAVTFSGTIALDRALAAAIEISKDRHGSHTHVIATSPSIDVMKALLLERKTVRAHFVESRRGRLGGLDGAGIVEEIGRTAQRYEQDHLVVILTSPENPTGEVWSSADLYKIALACRDNGGLLIVDHSFLYAGIHQAEAVEPVWSLAPAGLDWIAVWDTGKTFGFNEEKLGFLICGTDKTAHFVREVLNVIQFDVSLRQKLFFGKLLRDDAALSYVSLLHKTCRTNLGSASQIAQKTGLRARRTVAGSLMLLSIPGSLLSDEQWQRRLLAQDVGVVAAQTFFHTKWRPARFIRIALAREPDYFNEAIERLMSIAVGI